MAVESTSDRGSKKRLGLFGATMVGVGAMVGAGIFVLLGVAIQQAGPAAILAFLLCGVLSLLTAFSFAELSSAFPESGGSYMFAKKVFPIGGAFAAGWVLWFAYIVAAALYALGFASFFIYAIRDWFGLALPGWIGPVIATVAIGGILELLRRRGAGAGNRISFAKLIAFGVLILLGVIALAKRPDGTVATAMSPMYPFGFVGVLVAMGYVYIALEGFEVISTIGEEVKNPSKTIPTAMFLSIAMTLVVYAGLMFVVLSVGDAGDGDPAWKSLAREGDQAMAVAATRFGGGFGSVVVVLAGLLSTVSAMAAALLAASRVSFSMARDRALPRALSRVQGPRHEPVPALLASGAIAVFVILVTANVEVSGAAASLIFLLSFALANAAGLLVRLRAGAVVTYRAPFYPALPLLGIAACLGLAVFQAVIVPASSIVVLCWLLVGAILYRVSFGPRARTVSARSEAWDAQLVRLRGRTPLVLVAVANPERAEPLLRFAHNLANPLIGRVQAIAIARFDPQSHSQADGLAAYDRAEKGIREAVRSACAMEKSFEAAVLLAPNVTEAIARVAAERQAETVVLGMSNMARTEGVFVLEEVLGRTTGDVVVLNAPAKWAVGDVKRILVPVAGKAPQDPLRARLLGSLLREGGREARLLRVLRPGEDEDYAVRDLRDRAEDLGLSRASCLIETSTSPAEVIVRHSADADLLLLGFGRGGRRSRIIGPFALSIVEGAKCPVVAIAEASGSRIRT